MAFDLNTADPSGGRTPKLPTGRFALEILSCKEHNSQRQSTSGLDYYIVEFRVLKVFEQQPHRSENPNTARPAVVEGQTVSWSILLKKDARTAGNIRQFVAAANNKDWTVEGGLVGFDAEKAWSESKLPSNPLRGKIVFAETMHYQTNTFNPETQQKNWFTKHTFYPESQVVRFAADVAAQ